MPDYSKFYEARNIVAGIVKDDLVGPVKEDEVLPELPTQYYIMGKLYPQGEVGDVIDLARNPVLENEIESYDVSISLSNQKNPSSMGLTCALKPGVKGIILSGSYAFYEPVLFEEAGKNGVDVSRWNEEEKKPKELWVRKLYRYQESVVFEKSGKINEFRLDGGLQLKVYTHRVFKSGERIITAALVNTNISGDDTQEKSSLCVFQPELRLSSADGLAVFTEINRQENLSVDPELKELELLYSDVHCFGQGHGCAVQWDQENDDPLWVESVWLPSFNLHQMMAAQIEDRQVLSMNYLANAAPREIIKSLRSFIEDYGSWIKGLGIKSECLDQRYADVAESNIKKCHRAYLRMMKSVELLEMGLKGKQECIKAFQMANEAMLLQRQQTLNKNEKPFNQDDITWYPFQLAFILHEVSSFIDPSGEERKEADLLWFPTGGGKTEAYLGIAAFVILLRRLRDRKNDGVTVIMRYTLRLLTLQQFERASMLICACELLRKKYELGGSEISIGLWVGGKLTPNSLADARNSINKQQLGAWGNDEASNPCQIQVCPWCGEPLNASHYSVRNAEKRMVIRCGNDACEFHDAENGLPVHIIDESIYEHAPSFIVATIDKFAQIPLSDKPAALFGISNKKNPPDLIIQDELHLISGPLGTMTGIYEAAITRLCEKNGVGAKVIASTATIRNAKNQIRALYGRDYTQFPPQGLSAKDSYFAVESTIEDRPARQYLGVMGIGTTATTTLIRVNAALLFATRYLAKLGFDDRVVDNFWTITGYFNSLRELGGASTQILDDVQSRFAYLAKTKFCSLEPKLDMSESYDYIEELTSRMNNSEITKIIQDKLKRSYKDGHHADVYDFILASNMISVGVDVGRLGAMVVAGQPKTNAEYIQATSRVGRDNPGIVITVYNSTRSRDRSHYEQFLKYHSAMYRYVEATSLTPFADRARDRGLHALYVALCRYLVPGMLSNDCAVKFEPSDERVKGIRNAIVEYAEKIDPGEVEAVFSEIKDVEEAWDMAATGKLVYKSFKGERMLLKPDTEIDRFRTMNSMRNVDVQSGIYLIGRL